MADFIIASLALLAVLCGWLFVQYLARSFAARHPEFGPAREEGSGCGKSCLCGSGGCSRGAQGTAAALDNKDN